MSHLHTISEHLVLRSMAILEKANAIIPSHGGQPCSYSWTLNLCTVESQWREEYCFRYRVQATVLCQDTSNGNHASRQQCPT